MEGSQGEIVIAGASGFVGTHLMRRLAGVYPIRALTRSRKRAETPSEMDGVRWVECDLFGMRTLEESMRGAAYAIYLVHSMKPSARLVQADFSDLDLLLADNFARAAAINGLKGILYVGGILPDLPEEEFSLHLRSRHEVERILGGRGVPLTSLRAGMIIGPGGSSIRILINLVRRLPVMILPKWSGSPTYPLAIGDLCRAVELVLAKKVEPGRAYDLAGTEKLTYAEMIKLTAGVMGLKRRFLRAPIHAIGLSRLWVQVVSKSSGALVNPLLESLRHPMVPRDNPLRGLLEPGQISFEDALVGSLTEDRRHLLPNPRDFMRRSDDVAIRELSRVRSIQRINRPEGWNARKIASVYFGWIPKVTRPLVLTRVDETGTCRFFLRFVSKPMLQLTFAPAHSSEDRMLYWIDGGWLAGPLEDNRRARFEFRDIEGTRETIAAIHDFLPALPWWIYTVTQAPIHALVMRWFRRFLRKEWRRELERERGSETQ
ncbi:MAG: NAD-dependent epimerase/dehydratase family protein [Puniceicoccaceae bacterium]